MTVQSNPVGKIQLLGSLIGANFNSTADQSIALNSVNCIVTDIFVTNASTSLTLAAGGFYSAAAKGGTPIVAAAQVYSALTGATLALRTTIAAYLRLVSAVAYLSLTTAQGGTATADVYVLGLDLT